METISHRHVGEKQTFNGRNFQNSGLDNADS